MNDRFVNDFGDEVSVDQLTLPRSRALIAAVRRSPYAQLMSCRREERHELVKELLIIQLEVEVPQYPLKDICDQECVAVILSSVDDEYPEIYALRDDFPSVPHLNMTASDLPRSLCLYSRPWADVALSWTGTGFVETIRDWFRLTATGHLHAADQPLEPIIGSTTHVLIIPEELVSKTCSVPAHYIAAAEDNGITKVLHTEKLETVMNCDIKPEHANALFAITVVHCQPQQHGVVNYSPNNLKDLSMMLAHSGVDLLKAVREDLCLLAKSKTTWGKKSLKWILLLCLPKTRRDGGPIESVEYVAFMTEKDIGFVGTDTGVWQVVDGDIGLLLPACETKVGSLVNLTALNVMFQFSRAIAQRCSGIERNALVNLCLYGVGALGSQLFMNLIRMGFGRWTVIDVDWIQPHNLARHALDERSIGWPKAPCVSSSARNLLRDSECARYIVHSPTKSDGGEDTADKSCQNADIIVDCTTSISAARSLTLDLVSNARRMSVFLNPTGNDLVMLTEDRGRSTKLDCLEIIYYREILNNQSLLGHLTPSRQPVRYANSCRDLTSTISQDSIAISAGIASKGLRRAIEAEEASAVVWHCNVESLEIARHNIKISKEVRLKVGEWVVCTDELLLEQLRILRGRKLPNETGGVLIGQHDMKRKVVYIAESLLAPPDSAEFPYAFVRGHAGLSEELQRVRIATANNLDYVGEWHSHPDNCSCTPSSDDRQVFSWLAEGMFVSGYPPLMIIVGSGNQLSIHVDSIQ